jgi:hypothetical protein
MKISRNRTSDKERRDEEKKEGKGNGRRNRDRKGVKERKEKEGGARKGQLSKINIVLLAESITSGPLLP